MNNIVAAQQALEALEKHQEALKAWPEHTLAPHECVAMDASEKAITALRAALAQQAEPVEPVAVVATQSDVWRGYNGQWAPPGEPIKMVQMLRDLPMGTLLYTAPPQRKPLTEEEIAHCIFEARMESGTFRRDGTMSYRIARAVERAHGIGGQDAQV